MYKIIGTVSFFMVMMWADSVRAQSKGQPMSKAQILAMKQPKIQEPKFRKDTVYITSYGAKPGGVIMNTKSINEAIDACSKKGGGVVVIPNGIWLTGSVFLKSNINLHLNDNAMLLFSSDFKEYPLVKSNWQGLTDATKDQPLISAAHQQNIAITGNGVIDGNGTPWRFVRKGKLTGAQWSKLVASGGVLDEKKEIWYPSEFILKGEKMKGLGRLRDGKTVSDFDGYKDFLRPFLLDLDSCQKILLQDVTFQNSPAWCLHPMLCTDVTIRGIKVKNPWYGQNTDALDVESCNRVLIENSTFDIGDDAICLKSGRGSEGRARNVPTQNVIIRNNIVYHGHGGFVIGSEMSGGVKNVWVYDCSFSGTDVGLRFKTRRGRGGMVENIHVSNINMRDITTEAIRFDMYYHFEKGQDVDTMPVTEATPQFKDFYLDNVYCVGAERAIMIRGLPEMNFKNIHLSDMVLKADRGLQCIEGSGIYLKNVQLITNKANPVMEIKNSEDLDLDNISYDKDASLLVYLEGAGNRNIKVTNTDASGAKKMIDLKKGATSSMIKIN